MVQNYERRDERFALVLNSQEKAALQALADREGLSAAATLRRLLRLATAEQPQPQRTTEVRS